MKKVLSTKTLDKYALDYARSRDLEVDCIDFIETKAVKPATLKKADVIVFTSANAVENMPLDFLLQQHARFFSLSGKTEVALNEKGIVPESSAANAFELAELIIAKGDIKSVTHICGNLRLDTLKEKLKDKGIAYYPMIVYETILLNKKVNVEGYDAVMFFSPSGIESFFLKNELPGETVACCIGETTLEALKKKRRSAIDISTASPSPESMLESLNEYFTAISKNERTKA